MIVPIQSLAATYPNIATVVGGNCFDSARDCTDRLPIAVEGGECAACITTTYSKRIADWVDVQGAESGRKGHAAIGQVAAAQDGGYETGAAKFPAR